MQYGPTSGLPQLLKSLTLFLEKKGLPVSENKLMITTGSLQGINILAKTFINPGDTIITEPIVEREDVKDTFKSDYKGDMYSSDTSDIDVIKDVPKTNKSKEEDFFTSSYSFSNKDFNTDNEEDFFQEKNSGGSIIKIILLWLAIAVFVFVLVYFVTTYGIGV